MDPIVELIFTTNLYISIFTIICGFCLCFFASSCLTHVHLNLRLLYFPLLGILFMIPIWEFCLGILTINSHSMTTMFTIFENAIPFGVQFIRLTALGIGIERFIATIYSQSYERMKKCLFIGPLFLFIICVLSLFFGTIVGLFQDFPFILKYIFGFVVDASNVLIIHLIKKQNHQQRILSNMEHVALTQKYQYVENIRVLSLFRGHTIITLIFGISANLMGIVRYGFNKPQISRALVFVWYNLEIVALNFYWGSKSPITHNIISRITKTSKIVPDTVINAFGSQIKTKQTLDEHFETLKTLWH